MERVKIHLPSLFAFTTSIAIRITDVNYGGHVGNDSFLALIHEARLQFLKHYNYTEQNIEGFGVIMADAAIEFKGELFYGDVVNISVACSNFSKLGFDMFYVLYKQDGAKTPVGKAKTGMMCFDYTARKRVNVPDKFIEKMTTV